MGFVVLLHTAPAWRDGAALHSREVEFVDRCHVGEHRLDGDVVLGHDEGNLVLAIAEGNRLRERVEHRVDDAQFFQGEAFVGLHAEPDGVALGSFRHVGRHHAVLGSADGDEIFLLRCSGRLVDNLVDIGRQRTDIGDDEVVLALLQRGADAQLAPFVLRRLLTLHVLARTVYGDSQVACLRGAGVADVDVVLAREIAVQLVAQGGSAVGSKVDEAVARVAAHSGIPVVGVGDAALHVLEVHVLRLDDDDVVHGLGARRLRQGCRRGYAVGQQVSAFASAVDDEIDRSVVLHADRVGAGFSIVVGRGAGRIARSARGVLGERVGRLGRDTRDDNLVSLCRDGVAAVVVQVEIDVVRIFANDAARQFSVVQSERVARVVKQRNLSRCVFLFIQIGVRRVRDQLVAQTAHEEVALRHLGIFGVELADLLRLRAPARSVGRLLHLHGDGLGSIVVETDDERNGTIAARLLQVAVVLHPLAIAAVERVGLLVESVVEAAPCGIHLLVVAAGAVVDDDNLRLAQHFFAGGDVDATVDDLAEHVEPDTLEVGELRPVAARVAVDGRVVHLVQALLAPRQFRAVPHGTAVAGHLLHHRADAGGGRIFLAVVLAENGIQSAVPAAVVVAHAVVLGQSRDVGAVGDALVVVEARRRGVLIQPQNGLGVLLAGVQQVFVSFHHAHRVEGMAPDVAAERDGEESAVLMVHGHELGKQRDARSLRAAAHVASLVESPELFGIVPPQEVREALEEIFERGQVVVLYVGVAAAGRLTGEPHAVLLADGSPRLIRAHGLLRHLVDVLFLVVAAGERQV